MPNQKKRTASFRSQYLAYMHAGHTVSETCAHFGIHRSTLYKWIAISERGNGLSLEGKKIGAPSKKTAKYAHQIIAATIQHPNYSVDRLHRYIRNKYKCTNVSRHLVQVLLEKHNLTQAQGRKRFAKENLYQDNTANVRASILNASNNIKVTQKCKSLKVSRSTYYKWRAIYNKEQRLENNKAGVRSSVDPRIKKAIIDLIIMYPQWSVDKLYSFINENSPGQQLVSRRYIQYLLEKENLSTFNKRTVFSSLHTTHIPEAPSLAPVESQIITAETNRMVLARGDPPPPVGNYNLLNNVFTTIKNNSVASISTGIISLANAFLISKILIAIYQAETISQKIGMTLSSLALFCGLFFFLYSVKYYITIAAVIFKTNNTNNAKKESPFRLFNNLAKKIPFLSNNNDPVSLHKKVQETELSEYPFFSVQIPLYNEKKVANRVTAAAAAMDYPNFEVLVCDDSTDETTQLLYDKWAGSDKVKILHRVNRAGFKGAALANALTQMDPRTEYVVVFDADFVPYPDTLQLFAKYFKVIGQNEGLNISASELYNTIKGEESSASNLSISGQYVGKTVAVQGYQWHVLNKSENWITRAVRSEFAGSYIIERSGGQVFGLLKQIAGSVYAINAKVLREVGWGTSITEDFQLTLKLYEQGYKVAYTPYIQAPSECVSTLKRLIRQRQRWAEGHSFNIKKHLLSLLKAKDMTTKEKWEAVYLTPYYLQAFIFIFGSLCWIVAETILKVRLPFWTTTLGWSLVLTNLFSLPLMNTIGLFLEEGEERDYLGIFSFITLCYILAPFIGFAALKGFLEKEEGPWFRTPKSGHITDKINRSIERKRDRVTKYIPWIKPLVGVLNSVLPEKKGTEASPYLAYATASNGFNNFSINNRGSKIKKRIIHTIVVLALTITTIANIAQTTIPQVFANPDTYYARTTQADNLTDTANDKRLQGSTTIGASTNTQTLSSTNPTMYIVTDNMNKRWASDTEINDTNTTGERRNAAIATDSTGNTVAVWEDSRNTDSSQNQITANTSNMTIARGNAAVAPLLDGRVLFVGGASTSSLASSTAEVYDPVTSTFALISSGAISTPRHYAKAVTLNDGRVLVMGGMAGAYSSLNGATSIYDPSANSLTTGTAMNANRVFFSAVKLNNGKVLAIGGCSAYDNINSVCTTALSTSELYDPATATWTLTGNMNTNRLNHGAVLLPDGQVLISGGEGSLAAARTTSEIFNPLTLTWKVTGAMTTTHSPLALALSNDKVIASGGGSSVSEIFDPASQTWSAAGNYLHPNLQYANTLIPLGNGKILAVGGQEDSGLGSHSSSTAEVYDPATQTWTLTTNSLPTAKDGITPVLLPSGKVLIAGGGGSADTFYSSAALYSPITYDIYAQKYDKTGAKLWNSGTDLKVNSDDGNRISSSGPPNYNHLNPTVALDSSNNAIVAWEEQREGVFSSSVWSQKLNVSTGAKTWPLGTQNQFAKAPGVMAFGRTASDKEGATVTPLNNGKILIAGSNTANNGRSTAEIYDPAGRAFSNVKMSQQRFNHSSTPLLNGRVLLAGSEVSAAAASSAELYDPLANTFVALSGTGGFISGGRERHNGTLLKNGKVLLTGGQSGGAVTLTSSVLFDPTTNTFSAGANTAMTHNSSAAVLLPNGKVLLVGDSQNGAGATAAELFDPFTNSFSRVPGAHTNRGWNGLVLLNNGKVLSTGTTLTNTSAADLYDPVLNTWTSGGNMLMTKSNTNLVLLPNGKVLQAGGWDNNLNAATNDSEIYDPSTNTWTAAANNTGLTAAYVSQVYSPINNKIFLAKGTDGAANTTAELYTPVADMPVSTYDYKQNEAYIRTNLGSLNGVQYKKPKIAINSSGDATIAWQDNKIGKYDFLGQSYGFVNTAFNMFGANPGALGQCLTGTGCGNQSTMMAPPVQIVSQKICNQASCGIAGTTSGERQWGNDQANINKNSPEEKTIANIKNALNVNIVSDGTSMAAVYESDSGSVNQSTRTKKIYMQKLDVNGLPALNNTWAASSGNLTTARYQSTGTLLNDGTVLVSGGEDNGGVGLSTAEIYNPVTQTTTATTNRMTIGRMNHTATLLSNGQVLITGGGASSQVGSSSANLYNPSTGTFSATTGNMVGNRTGHTATLLRNGRVLIAGGKNGLSITYLSSAETFNPATGTFTAITGNMQAARAGHAATLLPDGRVMLAGGGSSSTVLAVVTANAYDPVAGTSAALSSMATARSNFTLTLLNNGKVLAVGGFNNSSVRLSSAELYDPLSNTWTATANSLRTGIRSDHAATLLPDGRVLITGGSNGTNNLSSTEIYDPVTGTFTAGNNLNGARAYHNNIVTPDGKVIVIGGSSATDTTTTTSSATAGTASAGTNWTTTSGSLQAAFATSDNIYAIYNNAGQNPEFLSNFGFSIPSNANITGVQSSIEGNGTDATAANRQIRVGISKDAATIVGTERSAQALNQTTDSTLAMPLTGAALDMWGIDNVTPADINSTNFGIRIRDNDTTAAALNLDLAAINVTYTTNSNVLSTAEIYNLNQKVSTADNTNSKNPDLVKDSTGNYQVVWQAWRSEGLSPATSGGSWKVVSQELNNPSSGSITLQYPSGSPGTWASAATMPSERQYPVTATLANGKVLVAGGANASVSLSSALVYDPQANTWTATLNNMSKTHDYHAGIATLSNGKTMIFGGSGSGSSTAEIYDPYTSTFTTTGNMRSYRAQFGKAVTLNNGKVLVAGGTDYVTIKSSSELYDPATGTWTSTTGNMIGLREQQQMVKLNNGNVLAIGGCTSDASCTSNVLTTVELFDANTNTWTVINGLNTARVSASANLLSNGTVIVMGGQSTGGANLSSSEIFDPSTQTWSTVTANIPNNAVNDNVETISMVLPNGKILLTRGFKGAQTYLFDPSTLTWSTTGSLTTGRGAQGMTLLKTGKVLIVGGYDSAGFFAQSSAELYTPELSEKLVSTDDSALAGDQTEPKIAADTSNGYSYVTWSDDRLTSPSDTISESNIYMQKLDGTGSPSWPNGLNENGTYNVRDVRIDTTRGALNTTIQVKPVIAKSVFTNTATDVPVQVAWTDNRDGTPATSIYGQSYNTRNYSMSSTNWTAYYYVTGSPTNANSISVQVGASEADGETMSYTSASSTYTGDGTNGEKSTVFSNLPPSGETSLTNRRLVLKLTTVTGSMQIQYNGASTVADTRLDVGTVVPERSLILVLIIPALPLLAFGRKKYRVVVRRKVDHV